MSTRSIGPWCFAACLVLGGGRLAAAQEEDSLAAVQKDYRAVQRANIEKQEKSPPPAGVSLPLVTEDDLLGFVDRCWKIYDRSEGEPEEFDSLRQILTLASSSGVAGPKLEQHWRDAAEKLFSDFVDDDRMAELVVRTPAPTKLVKEANACCEGAKAKTKNLNVKAAFAYKTLQPDLSSNAADALNETQQQALVGKLEELGRQFGPQKVPFGAVTYAEFVKNTIYAIEHLKVGAVAPEIAASDLDGVAFKLSDYRGKVVMLDFWGYW